MLSFFSLNQYCNKPFSNWKYEIFWLLIKLFVSFEKTKDINNNSIDIQVYFIYLSTYPSYSAHLSNSFILSTLFNLSNLFTKSISFTY